MSAVALEAAVNAYVASPQYQIDCDSEVALVELMAAIRDLPDQERHEALVEWARSPLWDGLLMLCEGWQGKIARAAYKALQRELAADSPGKQWDALDHSKGRDSIKRLLGVAGDPAAIYASIPFKAWTDEDDGRAWIAGAIGVRPMFDADAARRWEHLDIRDVILWDPRTNEVRLVGEHRTHSAFVLPDTPDARLKVWGDPAAHFRAWASQRARTWALCRAKTAGQWKHPASEPADGGLPGALLIGSIDRARWPDSGASTVISGPGLTAAELHMAAVRAANLPNFEGGMRGRGD